MELADQLIMTGQTVTALCTAVNQSRHTIWLYGSDSHLSQKLVAQQFEQAHRWWTSTYRDFFEPERHKGSALESQFYPGPCGKCPACALKSPATAEACQCAAPSGWAAWRLACTAAIVLEHTAAAEAIAECERVAAVGSVPGVAAPVELAGNELDPVPAAGPTAPENPTRAVDSVAMEGPSSSSNVGSGSHGAPDREPMHSSITPLAESQAAPAAAPTAHLLDSLLPMSVQESPLLQQHEDSSLLVRSAGAGIFSQQTVHPPQRQLLQAESDVVPQQFQQLRASRPTAQRVQSLQPQPTQLSSSRLLPSENTNPRALLGLQAHTQLPPHSLIGGATLLTQDRLSEPDQLQIANIMVRAIAPAAPAAPAPGDRVWVFSGSGLGQFSFTWPHLKRFFYITGDGNQKLLHYANCGKSHTAAAAEMGVAVPFGRYLDPLGDYMYKKSQVIQGDRDAATAAIATAAATAAAADALAATTGSAAGARAAAGGASTGAAATSERTSSAAAAAAGVAASTGEDDNPCQAELLAARSAAPRSKAAKTDMKVLGGCVCMHGVRIVDVLAKGDHPTYIIQDVSLPTRTMEHFCLRMSMFHTNIDTFSCHSMLVDTTCRF